MAIKSISSIPSIAPSILCPPDRRSRLQEFVDWAAAHVTGDEKGEAQIFVLELLKAFHQKGALETGKVECRIRKAKEVGGSTAFADFVSKPHVLIEMKKRGTDLAGHYRLAFDLLIRLRLWIVECIGPIRWNRAELGWATTRGKGSGYDRRAEVCC